MLDSSARSACLRCSFAVDGRPGGVAGVERGRAALQRRDRGVGGGIAGELGCGALRGVAPVGPYVGQPVPPGRAGGLGGPLAPAGELPAPDAGSRPGPGVRAAPGAPGLGATAAVARAATAWGGAAAVAGWYLAAAGPQPADRAAGSAPQACVQTLGAGAADAVVADGLGRGSAGRWGKGRGVDRGGRPLALLRQRGGAGAGDWPGGVPGAGGGVAALRGAGGVADRHSNSVCPGLRIVRPVVRGSGVTGACPSSLY